MINFIFLQLRDQPTQFYSLERVENLVRVEMGCLVSALEGVTQQDLLVLTKVIKVLQYKSKAY